ncbi:hypothetical protein B0T22DRAFT_538517 [Podospora appendiculata]|uniref:Uncharacterized protein n=1 Tax=Podospora appendiculata TaxID=314037 RepID=A0AAE0X238_9PEZI|nr:hypothetical protein B0T22DRAFT_538517 [Podospora appendiculata]
MEHWNSQDLDDVPPSVDVSMRRDAHRHITSAIVNTKRSRPKQRRNMHHFYPRYWYLAFTLSVIVHKPTAAAAGAGAQCYGINGQKSTATACNSAASGSGGSHSACCDESKQEACLSSGLCFATQRSDNATFIAEGCTDPMGQDVACPSYCGTTSQFISMPLQPSYTMLYCGASQWCCCYDNFGKACDPTECCAHNNFTLARGLGTVTNQFDNNATPSPSPTSTTTTSPSCTSGFNRGGNNNDNDWDGRGGGGGMRMIPMILVAGLLGSFLLAAIVAFAFSCSQNRRLRRRVETLQALSANLKSAAGSSSLRSSSRSGSSSRPGPLALAGYYPDETGMGRGSVSPAPVPQQQQEGVMSWQVGRTGEGYLHQQQGMGMGMGMVVNTLPLYGQPPETPLSLTPGGSAGYSGFPMLGGGGGAGRRPSLPRNGIGIAGDGHGNGGGSGGGMHHTGGNDVTGISELPAEKER